MFQQTIILASASPRRRELLARMGISFITDAPDVDEGFDGSAQDMVLAVAMRKAEAVAQRRPGEIILAADTTVVCDDAILCKPRDAAEATRMLSMLSGRWHEVYTGVCVWRGGQEYTGVALTRVHFTEITPDEMARYVATGDPLDKAGAYAIQGMAGMFIDKIEGCPHNVMGLPLALTKDLLNQCMQG